MTEKFLSEDFLLYSRAARRLYHEHAARMPIFDYHCHLPPSEIAQDKQFDNLTQIWLYGDHYKWRLMRANGVDECYCTGAASDYEKFEKWAETVPYTWRHPLYHWTHLELKRYFDIDKLLNPETTREIYESCNEKLPTPAFSVRNLLRKMRVKLVCTTDDPLAALEYHQQIRNDGFEVKVLPTWRADKAMAADNVSALKLWVGNLGKICNLEIRDFAAYLEAIRKRHDFFHEMGCRISDHGLETIYARDYRDSEIEAIFQKILETKQPEIDEQHKFMSALLYELAVMDQEKGWTQQFHIGALRNTNTIMSQKLGPDTGFDSMADGEIAKPLNKFFDRLAAEGKLAKTIVYNLNPKDNEAVATMLGSFQDGTVAGKMQYGSGWWFLDQKDGITRQLDTLSHLGLLSRFVGMVTDSRSFLSYPRHEYFRRILCNLLGGEMENGQLPDDPALMGQMVEDICYNNAKDYFGIKLD